MPEVCAAYWPQVLLLGCSGILGGCLGEILWRADTHVVGEAECRVSARLRRRLRRTSMLATPSRHRRAPPNSAVPGASREPARTELPLLTTLKVGLYALPRRGIRRAELARRLGWHREQVDRLFRLDHKSRLSRLRPHSWRWIRISRFASARLPQDRRDSLTP